MNYKVVKYGASWCNQCKMQDKEFEKNILKCPLYHVNIDELEEEEIENLNLKSIPVTILYMCKDYSSVWTELHRWIGFVKTDTINKIIEESN